jgi:uncharacterized protein
MLRVDLRDLNRGPVETVGRLESEDPVFQGLELDLIAPVSVEGRLQATGRGEYFWRARVQGDVRGDCRRCLADVIYHLDEELDVLFSDDPDAAADPAVYLVPPAAAVIDLGEVVREELALAVPPYLLCRDDCAGLCPRCGADLNAGACACAPAEPV